MIENDLIFKNISAFGISRLRPAAAAFFIIFSGTLLSLYAKPGEASPVFIKRTLMFDVHRYNEHWPTPTSAAPKSGIYSWIPTASFQVIGGLPAGAEYVIEIDEPTGKRWLDLRCVTTTPSNVDVKLYKTDFRAVSEFAKSASTSTGVFPFRIVLRNELAGVKNVIFAGTLNVKTYTINIGGADQRGKKEFYIEEDWRLPLGYIWNATNADAKLPPLAVDMWFKGQIEQGQTKAYLIFQGRPVAEASASQEGIIETVSGGDLGTWKMYSFLFYKARTTLDASSLQYGSVPGTHYLDKNPGEYEIRVLRAGTLVRSLAFTVGADGKVVDPGLSALNKIGGVRKLFPVKVIGGLDPGYNATSWRNEMLYGNSLQGVTAP